MGTSTRACIWSLLLAALVVGRPGATTSAARQREVPVTLHVMDPGPSCGRLEVGRFHAPGAAGLAAIEWLIVDRPSAGTIGRAPRRVVVSGRPGGPVTLLLRCPAGGIRPGAGEYVLYGPIDWPGQPQQQIVRWIPRRTVRVTPVSGPWTGPSAMWLPARPRPTGPWPRCARFEPPHLDCVGVPAATAGVLVIDEGTRLGFSVVPAGGGRLTLPVTSTRWARLVRIHRPAAAGARGALQLSVRFPYRSRVRPDAHRVPLVVDPSATVTSVGADAYWLTLERPAAEAEAVLRLEGPGLATRHVELDGWDTGSAGLPIELWVEPALRLEGEVVSDRGPVAGATLLVSETRRPPGTSETEALVPGPLVGEALTDQWGRFRLDGLAPVEYELLALDPRAGRRVIHHVPDGQWLRLRLEPPRRVTGRVVRHGAPVASARVTALPALEDFAASVDPFDHVGGEALTTVDGRFDLALPARGAVELRVEGGAGRGAIRQRLPDVAALPPVLDVGDLVLSGPIDVLVELIGPAGCDLHAAGPIGSPGIAAVVAARLRIGRHRLVLPEAGRWLLSASCVGLEHDVVPAWVTVEPDQTTMFLQLQVSGGS